MLSALIRIRSLVLWLQTENSWGSKGHERKLWGISVFMTLAEYESEVLSCEWAERDKHSTIISKSISTVMSNYLFSKDRLKVFDSSTVGRSIYYAEVLCVLCFMQCFEALSLLTVRMLSLYLDLIRVYFCKSYFIVQLNRMWLMCLKHCTWRPAPSARAVYSLSAALLMISEL